MIRVAYNQHGVQKKEKEREKSENVMEDYKYY